jgi:hypothetical protein
MGSIDIRNLMAAMDASLADNKVRLEDEIAAYLSVNEDEVARDLAMKGFTEVPTFAGIVRIAEDQLVTAA